MGNVKTDGGNNKMDNIITGDVKSISYPQIAKKNMSKLYCRDAQFGRLYRIPQNRIP